MTYRHVLKINIFLLILTILRIHPVAGQTIYNLPQYESNVITTAVPFLSIVTNPQAMGMGLIGVVSSDLYTQNGFDQNPARLTRGKKEAGVQLNYTPWLRNLYPDINVFDVGYYHSLNIKNALALSARYYAGPEIVLTTNTGQYIGEIVPQQFDISLKYAHNFSEHFSMGTGIKYIYSDITNGYKFANVDTRAGQAFAVDLGFDYRCYLIKNTKWNLKWNAGLAFLNIGSKISYTDREGGDFIPQMIKLGTLFTLRKDIDSSKYFAFDLGYQANKLLVPTPPIYAVDSNGNYILDSNNKPVISDGMDPDISSLKAVVQSFYDAPGGLKEELHEIVHQFGMEARRVSLDQKLLTALRFGFSSEHESKGDNTFYTLGIGAGYYGFRLDVACLLSTDHRNPYEETLSIGIGTCLHLGSKNIFRFKE